MTDFSKLRTVAIDFDGVIHPYTHGWGDGSVYPEPPMRGAIEAMERLIKRQYKVVIFTARENRDEVRDWLLNYWQSDLPVPEITNIKPPAIAYIDDRAIRFTCWSDILNYF